jgi:hypothetical protein
MATAKKVAKKTSTTKTSAKAGAESSGKKVAGKKALSPLEKARLARAAGGAAKKTKAKAKPGTFTFDAPSDFKPFFLEVMVRTEKDGLLGNQIRAIRYVGRYDPQAEDKKKFDISAYDTKTLVGLQARLAQVTFKNNPTKFYPASIKERCAKVKYKNGAGETKEKAEYGAAFRLTPNTTYRILFRIGKKSADNSITVGTKAVSQVVVVNSVKKLKALEKTDPVYKAFMKARRFMAAAFKDVLLPPKRTRGANKKADADE